jgi:hypothetical protein
MWFVTLGNKNITVRNYYFPDREMIVLISLMESVLVNPTVVLGVNNACPSLFFLGSVKRFTLGW